MADIDGDLIGNDFFNPILGPVDALTTTAGFTNPKVEDSISLAVSNSTTGGGGGVTEERQNPRLTRTSP